MHGQFQFLSKESGTGLLLLLCQLVSGKKTPKHLSKTWGWKVSELSYCIASFARIR